MPNPQPATPPDAGHVPMSEEMDRAKWTMPPVVPVIIAAIVIAAVVAAYTYRTSSPKATGSILGVFSAQQADQSHVLVSVQLRIQNADKAPLWIKNVRVQVKPAGNDAPLEDDAAASSDVARYMLAFPDLAQHSMEPLRNETKLQPGESIEGMVVVSFPLTKDAFDHRQSLRVILQPYDHLPVTISQ